jgi:hypothetical protein
MSIRNWIKKYFQLYDIEDLTIGGNCGCCGEWIPDKIYPKDYSWDICKKCLNGERKNYENPVR